MNRYTKQLNKMVRQLTKEERERVFNLWMSLSTYREISGKTGVSTGAIADIIETERKRIPEIDQLRNLKKTLSEEKINAIDAVRGAVFCKKLDDMNLSLEQLQTLIKFTEKYGEKAGEAIEAGQRLKELEQVQGKKYEGILLEYIEKTGQLQTLNNQLEDSKNTARKSANPSTSLNI